MTQCVFDHVPILYVQEYVFVHGQCYAQVNDLINGAKAITYFLVGEGLLKFR